MSGDQIVDDFLYDLRGQRALSKPRRTALSNTSEKEAGQTNAAPNLGEATLPIVPPKEGLQPATSSTNKEAQENEPPFKLQTHLETARQLASQIFDILAGENRDLAKRFDQEPNYTHLPLTRNGGIGLQISEGMPYRILTAVGAIPIYRGFAKKCDLEALGEKLGLETILPQSLLPIGSFGPIYAITKMPDGTRLAPAELRRGTVGQEEIAIWQSEFKASRPS